MMEQNYVQEMAERYVYAVGRRLSGRNRQDIEEELRSLIGDMLEARCAGREPGKEDIEAVLAELGDPAVLAEQYQSGTGYLIGPEYYPKYCALLKIVLPAVALAMAVVSFLNLITGGETPLEALTGLFSRAAGGVISGFFWVTIIFVIMERGGHKEVADEIQRGAATVAEEFKKGFSAAGKDLKEEFSWSPDKLPSLPQRRIKRGEVTFGLVLSLLVLLLFTVAPQMIGAWLPGDPWRCIPLFNLDTLQKLMPLFYFAFGLSFLRDVIQLAEGEYTQRMMWVSIACNTISLLVCVFLFSRPDLFNPNIILELESGGLHVNGFSDMLLTWFPKLFMGVFMFAFVLDTGEVVWRTLRSPRNEPG